MRVDRCPDARIGLDHRSGVKQGGLVESSSQQLHPDRQAVRDSGRYRQRRKAAVLTRAAESLQIDLGKALATARTPKQALASVAHSYIHLVLSPPDLIGTLIAEVTNLPEAQRHSIRQLQHDYVTERVRLLTEIRPDLDDTAARFLTHGVLTVINDIGRTKHLAARTHVATELYDLAWAMLENG